MSDNIFTKIPTTGFQETQLEMNAQEFINLVESRRSVRVFENTPIPEEIINKCLDLALLAPNSSNLQPWEFYWVRSKINKDKIIKACLSQPAASTAAELIVCVAKTNTWNKNRLQMLDILEKSKTASPMAIDYYKRIIPFVYSLGLFGFFGIIKKILLNISGLKNPTVREPTAKSDMVTWAVKSTSLACENLMLALRAYSYDSCPMEGYDSARIKKVLNLSRDSTITMVIGAGKRAPNGIYGPRVRFDRSQFVHEV